MCNLYHASPKGQIATHFRVALPDLYVEGVVGPFGLGAFIRPEGEGLRCEMGQWGLIRPGAPSRVELMPTPPAEPGKKPRAPRPKSTNNARLETVASRPTFRQAWRQGQRCVIPAAWYQEPNWETGKNIWWQLKRADGLQWAIAGLWSEWTDPHTGELVPNYTMLTRNCDAHPLLNRLHKPDPKLPPDQQDKRAVVHIDPANWEQWLFGSERDALALMDTLPLPEAFDQADAQRTDQLLGAGQGGLF